MKPGFLCFQTNGGRNKTFAERLLELEGRSVAPGRALFAMRTRVGRSCACLEPNSYAKRGQNLPKEAKVQFFKCGQINAKKPNFIANSFLIVLGIDTVQLFFYNQCDV